MVGLNIIGNTFAGDACATHGKVSKHIKWMTDGSAPISVHVDDGLFIPPRTNRKAYGWLLESTSITPQFYDKIFSVLPNYDYIFTYNKELLDLDPKFKLALYGTHWIKEPKIHAKTKIISMIASNRTMCRGHLIRHQWIKKLRNQVDFFGRGFNAIETKEEGLNDYMFSVAIENCCVPNYFTEKIGDCFATGTIPVYFGCSNIGDYFNADGIIQLDHKLDLKSLTKELYESKLHAVRANFELIKQYEIPEDYMYEHHKDLFN